jgi:hypothetical protein
MGIIPTRVNYLFLPSNILYRGSYFHLFPIIYPYYIHIISLSGWWFGTVLFSIVYGIILPIDELKFLQRGGSTTNQLSMISPDSFDFNFHQFDHRIARPMRLRSFTEGEGGEGWCFIDGWIPLVS